MQELYRRRPEYLWSALVLAGSLPLVLAICSAIWRTPYPIGETVALLADYVDASPRSFFDPTTRSWYRPLYHLSWWTLWRGTGSLEAALFWFKWFEIVTVTLLVVVLVWHLRPRTAIEGGAAAFALAVLIGTPGFRENLELPLLMTLVGMPIALIAWMLLQAEHRPWHVPLLIGLVLAAVGFKEQGLVIAPLVVAAWWTGARGARWTTAAAVVTVVCAYLVMRLTTAQEWRPFEQDVGLGFARLSAGEASDRFGAFPYWMYAYNAGATILNILFSEPTDGQFRILSNALNGELRAWEVNHVLSSAALTGLIAWWGLGTLRRSLAGPWSLESRIFIAVLLAVAASGALGFNYSRDRLGGMAVVFYAIAAYYAVRAAVLRASRSSRRVMLGVAVILLLLAASWQLRAIGTLDEVRVKATKSRREWITDLQERRIEFADEPEYLRVLNAMVDQGRDSSAASVTYPRWVRVWFARP